MNEEIIKGNTAILKYLGFKIWYQGMVPYVEVSKERTKIVSEYAKYHSSYFELMPVVEKLAKELNIKIEWNNDKFICDIETRAFDAEDVAYTGSFDNPDPAILNIWKAVVKAINHINKNKQIMKTGIELIADERLEQLTKHGRSVEQDVQENPHYQLSKGAKALIMEPTKMVGIEEWPRDWDADACGYMASKPYKDRLIIAGALIAAEIDRLNYIETSKNS